MGTRKNSISASNYTSHTEMKKKKKVRPEVNVQQQESTQEVNEGFEVVGKQNKRPYTGRNVPEGEGQDPEKAGKPKYRGTGHGDRIYNKARPQKRQYEKRSGTGRGKETAKNGAGGGTVWGDNPDQIARQAKNFGTRDDYLFESVLNPKKEEQPRVEEEPQQNEERKRKVETPEEEVPPEERLDRPEGALSLAEYREQMREKNAKLNAGNKGQTLNVTLPSDLKVLEKEKVEVKAKKVTKERKVDNSVQQININFRTEDNSRFQKPQQ